MLVMKWFARFVTNIHVLRVISDRAQIATKDNVRMETELLVSVVIRAVV